MNWADHCSSDEDSDDGLHPARLAASNHSLQAGLDDIADNDLSFDETESREDDDLEIMCTDSNIELAEEPIPYPPEIDVNNVPEDFPTQPPYTAHIRNLAYKINTPDELASKIEGLVNFRYKGDKRVKVANARIGFDRKTGNPKGFGYVEFETPKELMIFLNINDGFSRVNGRSIVINIARPPAQRNNNRRDNHRGGDRGDYSNISDFDGSKFRGGIRKNNDAGPPRERPSLKLAPRSKPLDNDRASSGANGDNWRDGDRSGGRGNGRGGDRRGRSDRGGRYNGNGGGRNGGGRGRRDSKGRGSDRSKDQDGWGAPRNSVKTAANPTSVAPKVEENKKVAKITNKFAALLDDSDSD